MLYRFVVPTLILAATLSGCAGSGDTYPVGEDPTKRVYSVEFESELDRDATVERLQAFGATCFAPDTYPFWYEVETDADESGEVTAVRVVVVSKGGSRNDEFVNELKTDRETGRVNVRAKVFGRIMTDRLHLPERWVNQEEASCPQVPLKDLPPKSDEELDFWLRP